ncbi:uncharacterized protein [Primulina huaijiensis]|uniref:uncharacterized protein n=1 Tax=Primulina huaijiensis TaxID=1492673 RepID=UPI003CC73894
MAEHRENDRHNLPEAIPIRYHFRPVIKTHYSGIARGTINANNFELKPALINMVQQNLFAGIATADPHVHLRTFLEITDTVKINNVPDDIIRLHLFPFSLRDQARGWLQSLPLGSIMTWQELATKFLENTFPLAEEPSLPEEAQYINNRNFGGFRGYRGNPPPNNYHPGLRNRENFSYTNNKNVLNPPPGFNTSKGEGKLSFEDLVGTFVAESGKKMARTESRLDNMETHIGNMSVTMKSLETQNGQVANSLRDQNRGQFPNNTEVNPKEQCKAVTLRSGKELEVQKSKGKMDKIKTVGEGEFEDRKENKTEESKAEVEVEQPLVFKLTLPYPQRFKKKNLDDQFAKFLVIFKKIHINIPFADAFEQMPNYAKFIKDVMSKKRKLQEFETVKLTEECSAILQKKLPQKLKDPESFTIPCFIGGSKCSRTFM